jgi:two-component sensor histidine kinase
VDRTDSKHRGKSRLEAELHQENVEQVEDLYATPDLAGALESNQFRRFLDKIPIAIALSDLSGAERIVYVNPDLEQVCAVTAAEVKGKLWDVLHGIDSQNSERQLSDALVEDGDHVGTFRIERGGDGPSVVDAYSNVIEDDNGKPAFRLVALVNAASNRKGQGNELEEQFQEKDLLLRELQHRVKNNLQMITALIRLEARNTHEEHKAQFDRLAGRIESLALLYSALSEHHDSKELDLGVYLSQIAAALMKSHASEGIRLDLKVDAYPVSVNVAMPTGLVVNELLTNSLKHAFVGRDSGTIKLHSLVDDNGCRIVVGDDGVGYPPDVEWPKPGKLSALIVQSLRQNAKAKLDVKTTPGIGTYVTISFTRRAAAAKS